MKSNRMHVCQENKQFIICVCQVTNHVRFSFCFSGSVVLVPGSSINSSVTFASLGPAIMPAVEMACSDKQVPACQNEADKLVSLH